jgi:hypothetical protein
MIGQERLNIPVALVVIGPRHRRPFAHFTTGLIPCAAPILVGGLGASCLLPTTSEKPS